MSTLSITTPVGLGDLIYIKAMLDAAKHRFCEIRIKFHREIIKSYHISPEYNIFLDELGALFFSESPYVLTSEEGIPFYGVVSIVNDHKITAIKPNLKDILCKGKPLNLDEPYLVIPTKVRYLARPALNNIIIDYWNTIRKLSQTYKIVILGERIIEMNMDYVGHGADSIYSIYEAILDNLPVDRVIDLTIPALGKTSPNLKQIQQDCLIMSQAKCIVTLGVGGAFCMATAVGNVIGYRSDDDPIANIVFDKEYPDAMVTKNWEYFIHQLGVRL